jgi:hypothetical protein
MSLIPSILDTCYQSHSLLAPLQSASTFSARTKLYSGRKKAAPRRLLRSTQKNCQLFYDLVQLTRSVTSGHLLQRNGFDLTGATGAAEGFEAG